jgi:hypothetical protein
MDNFLSIRYDSQTKDFATGKLENVMTDVRKEFGLNDITTFSLFPFESSKPIVSEEDFLLSMQDKKTLTVIEPKYTTVQFVFQNQTYVMNARTTDLLKGIQSRFCGFMGRPLVFEPQIEDPENQRVLDDRHVFVADVPKTEIWPVQLFVKGLCGKTTIVEVPDVYCNGSFVKNCIEIKHKIPARYQQILCNTKVVVDGLSLKEQDITAESTLHLSTKMIL